MKRRYKIIMALTAVAMLTACANSETTQVNSGAGAQTSGTGQTSVSSQAQTPSGSAGGDAAAQNAASAPAADAAGAGADVQNTQNVQSGSSDVGAATYDEANQSGDDDVAAPAAQYDWEGTFTSESGEEVTITNQDEYAFQFAFSVSGIYGQADIDGVQAIYQGDDDNQIVFNYGGNTLYVEVTNSNGDDTSESPLIGTYVKAGAEYTSE